MIVYFLSLILLLKLPLNEVDIKNNSTKESLSELSEGFEIGAYRWRAINKSGTDAGDTVQIYSATNAYDGNNVVRFGSYNTYNASEWLITPQLRVTNTSDTFVFYYKASHYNGGEVFELRIADSIPTGGAYDTTYYHIALSPDTVNDTVWQRFICSLGSYAGKNIQIAVHYMSNYKWYLYVDHFLSSALVDTIPPSIKLVYPLSHFRKPGQTRDTVKFVIKDTSGVKRAAVQDWGYKHPGDSSWTDKGYMELMRNGDTFYTVIEITDSLLFYFYVQAEDSAGNAINYRFFEYNILPTMDWLIVYRYNSDAQKIASYFALRYNILYPDTVYAGRFPGIGMDYVDSLYQGIIYATQYLYEPQETALIGFLDYGEIQNYAERKRLILFGDDIGYVDSAYHRENLFHRPYLRVRYIQDDWSSSTDRDTIRWFWIDDTFEIYSYYPDMFFPFSPDSFYDSARDDPQWVYINPARSFLGVINGDSTYQTYAGFIVDELSYLAHFMPFRPNHMLNEVDFDTLMDRIINNEIYNPTPPTIDSGKLVRPDSTVSPADSLTEAIFGFATASQDCENNPRDCGVRIIAQVGWGPDNSYPWEGNWQWFDANIVYERVDTINDTVFVRDTFKGFMTAPSEPGHYDYCYRYATMSPNGIPGPWIYADLDGVAPGGGGGKLLWYDYEPDEAGDLKVMYSYDISPVRIDTIIGKHWVGDTDSVFVVFKNYGYYQAKYNVFAYLNGVLQDTLYNMQTAPSDSDVFKLRIVYDKETGNDITIVAKWTEDENKSNDTIRTTKDANPYGLYLMENFDSWMPEGWYVSPDVSNGWELGTGSANGDPDTLAGYFGRFDSYYTTRGDSETLYTPSIEVWNIGNLRMKFYYINKSHTYGNNDSLIVMHNVNNTGWRRDLILHTVDSWTPYQIIYRDVGLKKGTIDTFQVAFYAVSDYGYTNIGIDSVVIFDATQLGEMEKKVLPQKLNLYNVSLNAGANGFVVKFDIPVKTRVLLEIYDVNGRKVKTLKSGVLRSGTYTVRWDGRDNMGKRAKDGLYFVRLKADDKTFVRKGLLLR